MSNSFPANDRLFAKAGWRRLVPACSKPPGAIARPRHVGKSLISDSYYSGMTKDLGNAERSAPKQPASRSALSRLAPALFPLVVVALGYLIGWQFFGF
ncbi:MAG: hypothetical protein EOR84_35265 [Mesorhizobium sp.]|uniref:hypothetical protein n=1 Tax=Mesorhizobium sp. TaxID=1871066 RepID=UPI000FE5CEA8|nr:hypothetical protein [Mesorhizobium sp.]RWM80150.1 MAG: hypothetical protein EOR84_35265 [Mesorhizobium sp.]